MLENQTLYEEIVYQTKFIIERLRVVARFLILCYTYLLVYMVSWATGMDDLTTAQSTLASTIVGIGAPLTKFYVDTGKNLYEGFDHLTYKNSFVKFLDKLGFMIDKWRLFPTAFIMIYGYTLFQSIMWGMDLGDDLTMQQVKFLGIYSGAMAFVIGFFLDIGKLNLKLEESYIVRKEINTIEKEKVT